MEVVLVDIQSYYMNIVSHLSLNKSIPNPFNCKHAMLSLYNFFKGLRKANTISGKVLHEGNTARMEMHLQAYSVPREGHI